MCEWTYSISPCTSNSCTIKLNFLKVVNEVSNLSTTTIFAMSNTEQIVLHIYNSFPHQILQSHLQWFFIHCYHKTEGCATWTFSNPPCHGTKKLQWLENVNQLLQSLLPQAAKLKNETHGKINGCVNIRICHVSMFISSIIQYQWNRSGLDLEAKNKSFYNNFSSPRTCSHVMIFFHSHWFLLHINLCI